MKVRTITFQPRIPGALGSAAVEVSNDFTGEKRFYSVDGTHHWALADLNNEYASIWRLANNRSHRTQAYNTFTAHRTMKQAEAVARRIAKRAAERRASEIASWEGQDFGPMGQLD